MRTGICADCGVCFPHTSARGPVPPRCKPCGDRRRYRRIYEQQKASGYRQRLRERPDAREKQRKRKASPRPCAACGDVFAPSITRPQQKCCGWDCSAWHRIGDRCPLPAAHPARWYGSNTAVPPEHPCRWFGDATLLIWSQCGWCAKLIIANTRGTDRSHCSPECKRRAHKMRRRSRETAYPSDSWQGHEFDRIVRLFGYCCAYCGLRPSDALQPDHVIPVSRGGRNRIANLLPACGNCNSDKRHLLLHEWHADRARRNLPPVVTTWCASEPRYLHLLDVMPSAAAAA